MFRSGLLTYMSGITLALFFLLIITVMTGFEVSVGEALYLSVLGMVTAGYGVTEWRLRRR